jgi:hypothetical protein
VDACAWFGEISRERSEELLRGTPDGTFLTRWSSKTSSYVLSYVHSRDIKHIAGILPSELGEAVTVVRADQVVLSYNSLLEYLNSMRQSKWISHPMVNTENNPYGRASINYGAMPNRN